MIINHEDPAYKLRYAGMGSGRYNGAYYYSIEICKYFVPAVETDRNWITINVPGKGESHSIVFIHNNLHPEHYDWLSRYKDLVLVCGIPETVPKMEHLGKAIYLPLSVDVEGIKKYSRPKSKEVAFAGRPVKRKDIIFEENIDYLEGLPRKAFLAAMAEYKYIYAVGRTAIEAKVLGCEILPYDERFPNPSRWQILDCRDAANILQDKLNEIDR